MQGMVWVALGGSAGAVLRHGAALAVAAWAGPGFPWATLGVNVVGSFVLGALVVLAERAVVGPETRLLLGTGLCGALTTFSTFSVESLTLFSSGQRAAALANVGLNVGLGFAAALLGMALARG